MGFKAPKRHVDKVYLHCSASDKADHDDVSVMRDWHVNGNGWSDVGYHYFIQKDGTVQKGRALSKIPAAQGGHNEGTIAICLHGLAEERFTKLQFTSLIALCREIHAAYQGMVTFHGHNEVSSKACPVFDFRKVLGLDAHGSPTFAPTTSPTTSDAVADLPLLRLMDRGPDVVVLQSLLSDAGQTLEEDGIFGQVTVTAVKAFQRDQGLHPDGIVGPRTWAELRLAVSAPA